MFVIFVFSYSLLSVRSFCPFDIAKICTEKGVVNRKREIFARKDATEGTMCDKGHKEHDYLSWNSHISYTKSNTFYFFAIQNIGFRENVVFLHVKRCGNS